jgi:hypothetical protein
VAGFTVPRTVLQAYRKTVVVQGAYEVDVEALDA